MRPSRKRKFIISERAGPKWPLRVDASNRAPHMLFVAGNFRLLTTMKGSAVPSLTEFLRQYPEFDAQLKKLDSAIDGAFRSMSEMFRSIRELVDAGVQQVANSPPLHGYEPMLIERGLDPIVARMTAWLLVRKGKRIAQESKWSLEVLNAIRFLAEPDRRRSAFVKRAQFLLDACEKTSAVQTLFYTAGFDEIEFITMLKPAVQGDQAACRRVAEIASSIAPRLSVLRGPKVGAASAAHESLLEDFHEMTGRGLYTYSDEKGDFVDSLTKATRFEFEEPDFDPRPARRRVKRRQSG